MITATNVNWSNFIDFISESATDKKLKGENLNLNLPKIQQMSKCTIFDIKTLTNGSNLVLEDIFFEIK